MKQFVTGSDYYEPVKLREGEFEALLPRFWSRLSVGWRIAAWKPLLDSPYGRVRPDALVLNDQLDRWAVVEIELSSHPESHFRSQFPALESAHYGRHLLDGVSAAVPEEDRERLKALITHERPSLLCVADQATDTIIESCRDFGFQLAVMTPYRSRLGDYGLAVTRMPREYIEPRRPQRFVLTLGEDEWGGRLLAELPRTFPVRRTISVRYLDRVHDLQVMTVSRVRRIFLPLEYDPPPGTAPFLLVIDPAQGLFELEEGNRK